MLLFDALYQNSSGSQNGSVPSSKQMIRKKGCSSQNSEKIIQREHKKWLSVTDFLCWFIHWLLRSNSGFTSLLVLVFGIFLIHFLKLRLVSSVIPRYVHSDTISICSPSIRFFILDLVKTNQKIPILLLMFIFFCLTLTRIVKPFNHTSHSFGKFPTYKSTI